MPRGTHIPERLTRRECLRCGYHGPELQADAPTPAYCCPRCREDLYARPPRSYAELEGIAVDAPEPKRSRLVTLIDGLREIVATVFVTRRYGLSEPVVRAAPRGSTTRHERQPSTQAH